MPRPAETLSITKGQDLFALAEQVRISPVPKLGGIAGPQIRFLSVSREQSIITDLELGSLAVQRRVAATIRGFMHRGLTTIKVLELLNLPRHRRGCPRKTAATDPHRRQSTAET